MEQLAGQVVIVTGGAGGIGGAVSRLLAREGARVLVNDLPARVAGERSMAERVVEEIRSAGGEAVASHTPVGPWESGDQVVGEAVQAFGRLDSVVLCAGNFAPTLLLDLTEAEWDSLLTVHATGQVSISQAAARQFVTQGGGGRIVTFASRAAFFAPTPAYAAAKAAVMGLSSAMARDLASHGVTVNCVLPSAQTPLFPGDAASRPTSGGLPPAVDVDPDSIAPIVAYLASDAAAGITGKFVYAGGSDICFYQAPLEISTSPSLIRKSGRWDLDELTTTIPTLLGRH